MDKRQQALAVIEQKKTQAQELLRQAAELAKRHDIDFVFEKDENWESSDESWESSSCYPEDWESSSYDC